MNFLGQGMDIHLKNVKLFITSLTPEMFECMSESSSGRDLKWIPIPSVSPSNTAFIEYLMDLISKNHEDKKKML